MGRPNKGGWIVKTSCTQYRALSITENGERRVIFEHRLIMEKHLGRRLLAGEVVHHRDRDGLNNSLDNLELTTQKQHVSQHLLHHYRGLSWDYDKAIEMRNQQYSLDDIAAVVGTSRQSVLKAFRRRGVSTANIVTGNPRWDVARAIELHAQGATFYRIAKEVGVQISSVRSVFVQRGIIPPWPCELKLLQCKH